MVLLLLACAARVSSSELAPQDLQLPDEVRAPVPEEPSNCGRYPSVYADTGYAETCLDL